MTYRTDGTEDAVVAGVNILPAPADSGNVGFGLDYLEKKIHLITQTQKGKRQSIYQCNR
jgi:hypothetical protein